MRHKGVGGDFLSSEVIQTCSRLRSAVHHFTLLPRALCLTKVLRAVWQRVRTVEWLLKSLEEAAMSRSSVWGYAGFTGSWSNVCRTRDPGNKVLTLFSLL